jgi:DNA-binding transcriptional LysR family regulator
MALDADRLRVFREVAAQGSFTRAARALSFTQPAVSHHINKLEDELGVTLMERSARGLTLTAPGETLLEHADKLLAGLDEAERHVVEVAGAASGAVRMVAFPSAAATLVPHAVAALRQQLPNASIALAEADPPDSLPDLKRGDWDLAITYDYPSLGLPLETTLDYETLFFDRMALCIRGDDPRAAAGCVELRDFSGDPWIAPYDSVCRTAIELACRQAGFSPQIVSESNDYMAIQGLVAAGVGVALVPRLVRAMAVRPEVLMRPVAGAEITRVVSIVSRADGYISPAAGVLRHALHESVAAVDDPALPLDRV